MSRWKPVNTASKCESVQMMKEFLITGAKVYINYWWKKTAATRVSRFTRSSEIQFFAVFTFSVLNFIFPIFLLAKHNFSRFSIMNGWDFKFVNELWRLDSNESVENPYFETRNICIEINFDESKQFFGFCFHRDVSIKALTTAISIPCEQSSHRSHFDPINAAFLFAGTFICWHRRTN